MGIAGNWNRELIQTRNTHFFHPEESVPQSTSPCLINAVSVMEKAAPGRGAGASFRRGQAPLK